ncbi:MAG: 50S ribosomal protein L3 N(5)-glutamine methyltransferase [Pseudomonadota bacterium]
MSAFENPPELETLTDYVRWTASRFGASDIYFGHGTDNAVDEALALVLGGLVLEPGLPSELYAGRLTQEEKDRLAGYVHRRISERVPTAYITNRAWFANIEFYVDERVLVPRSPIAELIENEFTPWTSSDYVGRVLEIGTGSGCIAVACAFAFPDAEIDALDISEEAIAVATRNVEYHGVDSQVNCRVSDLYAAATGTYDLIVTNPPYVDRETLDWLPDEYRAEPRVALDGGDDGLAFVHRILYEAPTYLAPEGLLVVEVGEAREALLEAYPDAPFTWCEFSRGGDDVFVLTREQLLED